MNTRYDRRSREAPMDFEFTDKNRDVIPLDSPFRTPAKRSHTDMAASVPPFPEPNPLTPSFCPTSNVPFMFYQPAPSTTPSHPWVPSPSLQTVSHGPSPEVNDVVMQDVSPPKPERSTTSSEARPVATGAMSRVFRARQKQKETSRSREVRRRRHVQDGGDSEEIGDEISSEDEPLEHSNGRRRGTGELRKFYSDPVTTTANHNHHYTFHMPTQQLSHTEIPYVLLGYLQFFFNLSLVLGMLYIMFYFIRAVQKDVEQKMAEHVLESMQEIKACASLYTDNFCAEKPSPIIMLQCHEWKACMERDASIVARTKLLAELIGEVINGFMEPISWRTLIFTITAVAMGIAFINTLLMFYRARHAPTSSQPTPPSNSIMYGPGSLPPYWAPSVNPSLQPRLNYHDQASENRKSWSMPVAGEDILETPSRRRKLIGRDDNGHIR